MVRKLRKRIRINEKVGCNRRASTPPSHDRQSPHMQFSKCDGTNDGFSYLFTGKVVMTRISQVAPEIERVIDLS